MSATLTPAETFQRVLGLPAGPHVVDLAAASVSAGEPQGHDPSAGAHDLHRARERNYGRIAALIAEMSDAHPGNDLVLFPSYRFLTEVAARMGRRGRACSSSGRTSPTSSGSSILTRARSPAARGNPPLRRLRRHVRGGRGLSGRAPLRRLRRVPRAAAGLLRARAPAALLRREGGGGLRLRVSAAGDDARRAGGGPADPQRDGPGRDRADLPEVPRGALRVATFRATGTTRRRRSSSPTTRPARSGSSSRDTALPPARARKS